MIQLIYASAATVEFTEQDLRDLLAVARNNNEAQNVSGMLLFHEGSFLQILEGEEPAVMDLFHKIEKDKRHGHVKMLLRSEIEERSFADWKMGFCNVSGAKLSSDEGFVDFFRSGLGREAEAGGKALAVLLQFREGAWRQKVDIDGD